MNALTFSRLKKILCIGAHADDIEIGCGGTLLRMLREHPKAEVYWIVLSASETRIEEARRSARTYLDGAGESNIQIKSFRDSFFPYDGSEIKDFFHSVSREFAPDVIFTHRRDDLHQDHRLVADLTWNAFRNHLILEYEIPKYDGDLGHPNLYVTLDKSICERKVDGLLENFVSQREKPWFTHDTFLSLMRIRGIESNSPTGMAEAFHCRKTII